MKKREREKGVNERMVNEEERKREREKERMVNEEERKRERDE